MMIAEPAAILLCEGGSFQLAAIDSDAVENGLRNAGRGKSQLVQAGEEGVRVLEFPMAIPKDRRAAALDRTIWKRDINRLYGGLSWPAPRDWGAGRDVALPGALRLGRAKIKNRFIYERGKVRHRPPGIP